MPDYTVVDSQLKILSLTVGINNAVRAAKDLTLGHSNPLHRIMTLDAEWDVEKTATGMVRRVGRVAVIQVSQGVLTSGYLQRPHSDHLTTHIPRSSTTAYHHTT